MTGRWRRLIPGVVMVLLFVAACADENPPYPGVTSPTPAPPAAAPPTPYNGAWSGTFTITGCVGRRHCVQGIGSQQPFVLRLSQSGDRVSGVFQTEERAFQAGALAVPVEGVVSVTGSLALHGMRPSLGFNSPTIELTVTSANDEFTQARFAYEARYPGAPYNPNDGSIQSLAGVVTQAVRGAVAPQTSFEGTWRGEARIRECATDGWPYCWPDDKDQEYSITLVLTQNGDRVSGTLSFRETVNVAGSIIGNTVTFDETSLDEGRSGLFRITRCALTRDVAGQLTGMLSHQREFRSGPVSRYHSDVWAVLIP